MDIIEEGFNGHLVEVKDATALAQRVLHVVQLDAARWQVMSDAAYTTAVRYSWDDATALFEAALLRTIQSQQLQPVA
jgi:glycosyltransferase involved in cell wall biosynthesis